MGGQAPPPVDWKGMQSGIQTQANQGAESIQGAAQTQLQNNRLNTSSPFASQTFGPDGTTSTQFSGGLNQAAMGLMGQAGQMAQPMDWAALGKPMTGDAARQQAIDASYSQAASRLDPMWARREEGERTRLLNQGLAEDSEAYKGAMSQFGQQRNDAYGSAMNSAIGQGTAAGDSAFRNNMMSHQQNIADAIRQRQMPLEELGRLQGFLGQPSYNADNSTLSGANAGATMQMQGLMGANALAQQANDEEWRKKQEADAAAAGTASGVMSGIGTAAGIAAMFF